MKLFYIFMMLTMAIYTTNALKCYSQFKYITGKWSSMNETNCNAGEDVCIMAKCRDSDPWDRGCRVSNFCKHVPPPAVCPDPVCNECGSDLCNGENNVNWGSKMLMLVVGMNVVFVGAVLKQFIV